MVLGELENYETINTLRKRDVISADKLQCGRLIDIIFDQELNLHSFLLGGSRFEELREVLGLIEDIDPVIPISSIDKITKQAIKINIQKKDLRHKLENGVLPEKNVSLTNLKRKKIVDSKGNTIGKIVNMVFIPSGDFAFIIGGNWLEEFLESIKFKTNVDLLLPVKYIESFDNDRIKLNITSDKLRLTLDNKPLEKEAQDKYLDSLKNSDDLTLHLLAKPKAEHFMDTSRFH
ncbi:MAG: PRC-barrel domain-containing protein [Asgard group archaeon]|nr:PRC-barrel domain-containing protein [Asgard group archaeon]